MQVTNQISYLIEEMKKTTKLLQDLEKEFILKFKTKYYYRLKSNYNRRIKNYIDKVNLVGKVGILIRVTAIGPEPVRMSRLTMNTFKKVELFFSNISKGDVEIILKRDYNDLHDIEFQIIPLGEVKFLE